MRLIRLLVGRIRTNKENYGFAGQAFCAVITCRIQVQSVALHFQPNNRQVIQYEHNHYSFSLFQCNLHHPRNRSWDGGTDGVSCRSA